MNWDNKVQGIDEYRNPVMKGCKNLANDWELNSILLTKVKDL